MSAVRRDAPIGVFDSGVGGLTVLKELRRQLPGESTVYLGDEARMPYGEREGREVVEFTRQAVRWFEQTQAKLLVVACNTASATALEAVRECSSIPLIGVIRPGAAAALSATSRRSVGVLATRLTVRSGAYVRAIRDLDPFVDVLQQPCPKLVPMIEAGRGRSDQARRVVREYVLPLLKKGDRGASAVDTLLLGCTHYPLVRWAMEEVAGPAVRVVDSATTTALAVREVLESHGLLSTGGRTTHRVLATGEARRFAEIAQAMFGEELDVEQATLG